MYIDLEVRRINVTYCIFAWKEGCIGNRPSINLFSRPGRLQWTVKNGNHGYLKAKMKLNFWPYAARKCKTFDWWMLSTFWGVSVYCETTPRIGQSLGESLWGGKLVKNKWIIIKNEFGFHTMWRIMQMSKDVINHDLGLPSWWITSTLICTILHTLLKPCSIIAKYFLVLIIYPYKG